MFDCCCLMKDFRIVYWVGEQQDDEGVYFWVVGGDLNEFDELNYGGDVV